MPYQTNSRHSAVLWDTDGTLVDTERHWMAAQRRLARDHDVEWTDADAHATGAGLLRHAAGPRSR
jgi:beta-phosphoglucomutase-like phosphatase (HAD superfamily)